MKAGTVILNLLFPPHCPFCSEFYEGICPNCLEKIKAFINYSVYRTDYCDYYIAPFLYKDIIKDGIIAFKYKKQGENAPIFAEFMNQKLSIHRIDGIINVPKDHGRGHEGFDISKKMSQYLAKIRAVEFIKNGVKKKRSTKPQHLLTEAERYQNLKDCFIADKNKVAGKKLLICDDIITTGSTINEVARACKEAGAVKVYAVAIALAIKQKKSFSIYD